MSNVVNYDDPKKYNLLLDIQKVQISPFYAMRMVEIRVSTNPADGDIYKVCSKQNDKGRWEDVYALSKGPLEQMAKAAGVIWSPTETGTKEVTRDYVLYEAVGAVRSPSGEYMPVKGSKEIDLLAVEAETRKSKRDYIEKMQRFARTPEKKKEVEETLKGRSVDEWVEIETQNALIQWRKNKVARAETGAMLRAIRKLLTIKNTYTIAELQKPFVLPCVDFSPDYNDHNVRMMIQQQGMRAASDLFGVRQAPLQIQPHIEIEPAAPVVSEPEPPAQPEPPAPPAHEGNEHEYCRECGVHVSPKVIDFSKRKYGVTYCIECQKGRN